MPQFAAALLLPLITNSPIFFLGAGAVSATATGLGYLAVAAGAYALNALISKKPDVPKQEDGKYNLRQNVPPPSFVLGKTKKGSDYLALEENKGAAWHVMCPAGHRINAYVQHYLHDEAVTLDVGINPDDVGEIVTPAHFDRRAKIKTRLGLDVETAYADMVAALPTIWTANHRGDGIATVMIKARSVSAEDHQKVYPNSMPVHTSVIEGALLYDPRQAGHNPLNRNTWTYSENLALMRLWHVTHPVGLKLKLDDVYLPEWTAAANVCDEAVVDRSGINRPRYHGGFWFRSGDDPVAVGRTMDQAAEMVLYDRADGKIGVHSGKYTAPDIRLTEKEIISVSFDANRRKSSTVLAVRGRFTDPTKRYNEVDAAIVGNPYTPVDDATERTKTVSNVAVQRHNHIQRLQTLALTRANAPRVRIVAHYEPAKNVPYRRFVKVHYLPRLNEAIVEIIGRPKLSLRNLTYEFEGIVVPATLFDFVSATQEGDPPSVILEVEQGGVPAPVGFTARINLTSVGGSTLARALATWTQPEGEFPTEVEWEPTAAGGERQSVMAKVGELEKYTSILADGVQYKIRARHWSSGTSSNWTSYVVLTAPGQAFSYLKLNGNYLALNGRILKIGI